MKKIAKLSLVAAVAVVGLTTANAQPLEEAIKNVDVSGSVVYRYNDYSNDNEGKANAGSETQTNNYKVGLNLASKVNDDVKLNTRFLVASEKGDFASLNYSDNADGNVGVSLSNVYFGYTGIQNTTVNVGKQGLTTPWTVAVDSDGNEQTGTGILALSTVGPVTLAAAYFNQTNLGNSGNGLPDIAQYSKLTDYVADNGTSGDNTVDALNMAIYNSAASNDLGALDVATVGAIGVFGPVTVDAWYLDMQDTFDTYTLGAKAATEVSGIKLGADARFTALTLDDQLASDLGTETDNSTAKIVLTGDAGLVDAKIAYATTNKDGGLTALDNDANTTLLGWSLTSNGKADADYWQAVLGFDILSNLNLSANYGNLQYIAAANSTTDIEEEEIYAQLLYKMSKNLTTYVRYGTYTKETSAQGVATVDNNDDTRGRLQVEYTF